jgi:hypothetical protein
MLTLSLVGPDLFVMPSPNNQLTGRHGRTPLQIFPPFTDRKAKIFRKVL